jgi:sorbitol-specific phosphotransferase system component IIBC
MRKHLPDILALLSVPVGIAAYIVTGTILQAIAPGLAPTFVGLFVPLFAAGICIIPFVAPWFDRRAKADLAAIQARRADEEK